MQFSGWWVSGDNRGVTIRPAVFDETHLSEASDWREAHQNTEPDEPHGYVDLDKAMEDARVRLAKPSRSSETDGDSKS